MTASKRVGHAVHDGIEVAHNEISVSSYDWFAKDPESLDDIRDDPNPYFQNGRSVFPTRLSRQLKVLKRL